MESTYFSKPFFGGDMDTGDLATANKFLSVHGFGTKGAWQVTKG